MTTLIFQIFLWLFGALLIGLLVGWFILPIFHKKPVGKNGNIDDYSIDDYSDSQGLADTGTYKTHTATPHADAEKETMVHREINAAQLTEAQPMTETEAKSITMQEQEALEAKSARLLAEAERLAEEKRLVAEATRMTEALDAKRQLEAEIEADRLQLIAQQRQRDKAEAEGKRTE